MARGYMVICPSGVCVNVQILSIIKARDAKFSMEVSVYHKQIKFISKFISHAYLPRKLVINFKESICPTFCFQIKQLI